MRSEADGTARQRDGKDVVRFQRRLAHPIGRVWAALTSPDELHGWLGDAEIDLREGGRFVVCWLNTDEDGNAAEMHATITALDPPRLLETEGDIHGVLRWELEPDGDSTVLTFTSTLDLPDQFRFRALAGWHFHLDALDDALRGQPFDWSRWEVSDWEKILHQYLTRAKHEAFIEHWNAAAPAALADLFAPNGSIVGFDGSSVNGREEIATHLGEIFASHRPARYVAKVREIRTLADDVVLLRAVVGMVPPGEDDIKPEVNAVQTLVAVQQGDDRGIAMLQSTPAQFHGRPDESERLTAELREVLRRES
ncbi:MAG: SgcJ/EcaC family oxidoreductase [Actinomycetota bacterium]|nr:SgcJ/EcaC family oxidoreductase [Actinomycetota bacterium]